MPQYVTRVRKFTVLGKSHIIVPQPARSWIETACGKLLSLHDDRITVSDQPECKGVCRRCERESK